MSVREASPILHYPKDNLFPSCIGVKKERFPFAQVPRAIAITGDACSGSTSLAKALADVTGMNTFFVGDKIREQVYIEGVSWDKLGPASLKKVYDETLSQIQSGEATIVDGRFVGIQAHNCPDVVTILCTTHPHEAERRFQSRKTQSKRDKETENIIERIALDTQYMLTTYGISVGELFDHSQFDIVLDTTHHTPEQIAQEVLRLVRDGRESFQRDYWDNRYELRREELKPLAFTPNHFARKCIKYLPKNAVIIAEGESEGRDARYFAREINATVFATDIGVSGLRALKDFSKKDNTSSLVLPVIADVRANPFVVSSGVDAFYARSSLHVSDWDLQRIFANLIPQLKRGGYIMVEGKPENNFKIERSEHLGGNLYRDTDGHLRRMWTEENIQKVLEDFPELELVDMQRTQEKWEGKKSNFIHFIARKKLN